MRRFLIVILFVVIALIGFAQNTIEFSLTQAGTLSEKLPADNEYITPEIKVKGPMDDNDLAALAGWCGSCVGYKLDLSEAMIERIPSMFFRRNDQLEAIVLPKNLKSIGRQAFAACRFLTYVDFSFCKDLTTIEHGAFYDCALLNYIDLSRCVSLKEIEDKAFCDSGIRGLILPENLEEFSLKPFRGLYKGSQLSFIEIPPSVKKISTIDGFSTKLKFTSENVPELEHGYNKNEDCEFYVPKAYASKYASALSGGGVMHTYDPKQILNYKIDYNEGGTLMYKGSIYQSGQNIEKINGDGTDIQMQVVQDFGYHIDNMSGLKRYNNLIILSAASGQKEGSIVFAKDEPVYLTVDCTEGGIVKIYDKEIETGTSLEVNALKKTNIYIKPEAGYCVEVLLGKKDKGFLIDNTEYLKDNYLVAAIQKTSVLKVSFKKKDYKVSIYNNYDENHGVVKVNNSIVEVGKSLSVRSSTDVEIEVIPDANYYVCQAFIRDMEIIDPGTGHTIAPPSSWMDVTEQVNNGVLIIPSISKDKEIRIAYEKLPVCKVITSYSGGGKIKINDRLVQSGDFISVNAMSDVKITILPDRGYHLKSMNLGDKDVTSQIQDGIFVISNISEIENVNAVFEKDVYTVKAIYSEGGSLSLNGQYVASEKSIYAYALTDVKVLINPNNGYCFKQVKVGTEDVTDQVVNNFLTISDILENKEISVLFEKITNYSFRVSISGSGKIKVDGKVIENGTSVTIPVAGSKLEFLPDNQYCVAKVLLDSKDITKEIVDNIYNITSVSSDMSLSVAFEKIPTYKFNINMTGGAGSIKIGDKTVTKSDQISDLQEGTMLGLSFLPDNYYEVKKVTLGGSDITSQIRNGYYEIQSIESDLTLSVEYQRKSYTLTLSTTQGIGNICVNQKEYKDITQIKLLSGDATIAVYSNELYYIKQVLLTDKVIYDDKNGTSAYTGNIKIDIDCDKDLTVILTLREKRQLSVKIAEAGTLNSLLSEDDKRLVTSLIVEGEIDQRDFEVMNQMESLAELNLENATVVKYGIHLANTIPDKAFYNNQKIQSMYLPKSIETIGNQSFSSSVISAFPSMEIYEYLTKIGKDAFKNCSHLVKSPNLNSVELIEEGAFENCSNMYVVGVLSNVKEIKSSAFKNCVKCSIQFITGSNDVCLEKVGDYAFENMKAVYFDGAEKLYYIGHQALKGCQNTSFNFSDCLNLTELPSFENCSKMQSIVFPPKVKRVDSNSFIGCSSLQTVHMKENISVIEEYAFKDCPMIDYVYLAAEEIPKVSVNSFCNSIYQTARLFVPVNRLQFYKEDAVWGKFENIRTVGLATEYRVELLLSEGGTVGIQHDEKDWEYYYYGYLKIAETSRIYFHVRPEQGFVIESVVLNDKDITNTLDENNQFVIPYLMENTYLDIKFKKESDPTSIDHAENAIKCVYRSAPRRLTLSGFKAGVPVYVYDSSGRLVILRTIRDGVEVVSVPAEGLYFVRIGKESFKVIL